MSLDPTSVFLVFSSVLPVFYLGWASLNCFFRKTEEPCPEGARPVVSRLVSECSEVSSPRSCRSSIDSQLVSWERMQQPPEVWDE
jgi:hypothetical protein